MNIIPAIDIRGGKCVRFEQGDYDRETVFDDDPVSVAERWQTQGARRLHVVDLDGAREGRPINVNAVTGVLETAQIPVQVSGGVRDLDAIQAHVDAGANRVVLGTAAIKDQTTVQEAVAHFRDKIIVSVDARAGIVRTEGWTEGSEVTALDLVRELAEIGVRRIVYTDISADGMLDGPNFASIAEVLNVVNGLPAPMAVIAAGGVSSVDHLRELAKLGTEAAILGKSLYTGSVDLREALNAVSA
jgi:phosphoribosylformimino-5-aminoimidazole carboxamide ribotide isomerase